MLLLSSNIAFHNIAKMGRGERKEKILAWTTPSMLMQMSVHDKLGKKERKAIYKKGTEQLTRAVYYSDYIFTTASLCSAAAMNVSCVVLEKAQWTSFLLMGYVHEDDLYIVQT